MCLCVGVFVCIWGKRRRWGEGKLLSLLSTEKREKGSKREINKIINGRATVTMYIYTVTVARVEIYTFLHNFRSTDMEHFWVKMCKKSCFLYFTRLSMDWCGCSQGLRPIMSNSIFCAPNRENWKHMIWFNYESFVLLKKFLCTNFF